MNFTDLEVWRESRILVKMVYETIQPFPKEEMYGLQSQIKRSAISIPSNIAEGCGRNHIKDTIQFLYIARGSAFELETQLYLSLDLNFIDEQQLNILLDKLKWIRILLAGFIKYHKGQIS